MNAEFWGWYLLILGSSPLWLLWLEVTYTRFKNRLKGGCGEEEG